MAMILWGGGGGGALRGPKMGRFTPERGLAMLVRPKTDIWGYVGVRGQGCASRLPGHPEVKGRDGGPRLNRPGSLCACAVRFGLTAHAPLALTLRAQPEAPPLPARACAVRRRPAAMAAAVGGGAAAAGSNGAGMEVDAAGPPVMAGGVPGSVAVALHPLVILNISDHWIRMRCQEGRPGQGECPIAPSPPSNVTTWG
uniref:Uncharacterized protein n=1 Tax=Pavo cristatus TaxID=9049 RepID=A0A8C9FTG5_PAVCR